MEKGKANHITNVEDDVKLKSWHEEDSMIMA